LLPATHLFVPYMDRCAAYGKYSDSCGTPKYFSGTVVAPGAGMRVRCDYARNHLPGKRLSNRANTRCDLLQALFRIRSVFSPGLSDFYFVHAKRLL
jgi:hypothetical protein